MAEPPPPKRPLTSRFRDFVLRKVIGVYLHTPQPAFDSPEALAEASPPAPEYANPDHWAAFPGQPGPANIAVPTEYADIGSPATAPVRAANETPPIYPSTSAGQDEAPGGKPAADCFYLYPTMFFGQTWNASVNDEDYRRRVEVCVATQASAFSETCRVYCPHYRQMTFGGFVFDGARGRVAMDLAYSDVRRAFLYYLEHLNGGRPFVLASHSQGTMHLNRLIEEEIDGRPEVLCRFVCGYLIGGFVPLERFAHLRNIKPCDGPTDTQCIAGWDTRSAAPRPQMNSFPGAWYGGHWHHPPPQVQPTLCTSPYTWRCEVGGGSEVEPESLNQGVLFLTWYDPDRNVVPKTDAKVLLQGLRRTCRASSIHRLRPAEALGLGALDLRPETATRASLVFGGFPASGGFAGLYERQPLDKDNYHKWDYMLFFYNIRANVKERVAAFLERGGVDTPASTSVM